MKIVVTGGGSGGHIMPILAVAHELKKDARNRVIYVGQIGDKLSDVPAAHADIDEVCSVWAGKFRRYPNLGWRQLLQVRTQLLNVRDAFRVLHGLWQSFWLLRRLRPDVIFTRGGFVSVPVALAGRLLDIPYITHDSDSTPSLANRIIAHWATKHAVALDPSMYPYPLAKTVAVGVPVGHEYHAVTPALRAQYRQELGLSADAQVVLVTGGGLGSQTLNEAVVANARYMLSTYPELILLHITGRDLERTTNAAYDALGLGQSRKRVVVKGFVTNLHVYSGSADVVMGRAGATTVAEFALQARACIMVPPPQLAWAVQNSRILAKKGAVVELSEDHIDQPERLGRTVGELLDSGEKRQALGAELAKYAHPHAAADLAALITEVAGGEGHARANS